MRGRSPRGGSNNTRVSACNVCRLRKSDSQRQDILAQSRITTTRWSAGAYTRPNTTTSPTRSFEIGTLYPHPSSSSGEQNTEEPTDRPTDRPSEVDAALNISQRNIPYPGKVFDSHRMISTLFWSDIYIIYIYPLSVRSSSSGCRGWKRYYLPPPQQDIFPGLRPVLYKTPAQHIRTVG